MNPTERIIEIIEPSLNDMGFDLVRVLVQGQRRPTLQVMAERRDRAQMTVDDCAEISRTVSALLDVEDPFPTAYQLEVSSPGIDRPLVRAADFDRFKGFEARIETAVPLDGRRRFKGRLLGIEADAVRIALPDAELAIPLDDIKKAKLVLTDELLAAARAEQGR
ncbi:MAG TPA: ribosome maturation factor RimP [Geminicoccaceae bacterium]